VLKNVRRYFRYDLQMSCKILPVQDFVEVNERLQVILEPSFSTIQNQRNLEQLIGKLKTAQSKSLPIFTTLEQRLEFIAWMLKHFAEGKNPKLQSGFAQKYKLDKAQKRPNLSESSHIAPLILGLYDQIDWVISELLDVIRNTLRDTIFFFPVSQLENFFSTKYITNLSSLAGREILPAQILESLIAHFNVQIESMNLLIEEHKEVSDIRLWPNDKINLSAGGIAFNTRNHFEKFSLVDCLLNMDGKILLMRGKVLNQIEQRMGTFKTVVDFVLPTEVEQSQIHLFIQKAELIETMEWQKSQSDT